MAEPFLGEIRIVGFTFAPSGWAFCNGQILPISTNTALFSLLGTTYGGNGTSTFALPDLRSRVPLHQGQGAGLSDYVMGEVTGTESVTLLAGNLPSHHHGLTEANAKAVILARTDAANASAPTGAFLGGATTYVTGQSTANTALNGGAMKFVNGAATELTGSNQPHSNIQPILCVNFIIALAGIFPSRN